MHNLSGILRQKVPSRFKKNLDITFCLWYFACAECNIPLQSVSIMTFDVYGRTPKHTQTIIDATQKETAIDQQQYSFEKLTCQRHQTIVRLLSSAATASTR